MTVIGVKHGNLYGATERGLAKGRRQPAAFFVMITVLKVLV